MRILEFKVTAQVLECAGDFSDLVPGTSGYLYANFTFSDEWDRCVKVASFFDRKGKEYAVFIKNGRCQIPDEVLAERYFKLHITGAKDRYRILTNKLTIKQGGG